MIRFGEKPVISMLWIYGYEKIDQWTNDVGQRKERSPPWFLIARN